MNREESSFHKHDGAISIVIPTYNRLKTIKEVLPSYLNQESVREVIIVDDASSDGTEEFLRKLEQKEPHLIYVRNDRNLGAPASRNVGVLHSSGEYVLFGEDDLHLRPDYARRLQHCLEKHGAGVTAGRIVYPFPGESDSAALKRTNIVLKERLDRRQLTFNASAPSNTAIQVPFIHAINLVRRDIFDNVKFDSGYRGNAYREETDFHVRVGRSGYKIYFCPEAVCIHLPREVQQLGGQMSRGIWVYKYWSLRNNYRFLRRHYDYLKSIDVIRDSFISLLVSFAIAELKKIPSFYLRKYMPGVYTWLAGRMHGT